MLCKDDPLLEKTGGVKPYGTAPELERRADVLVYEVFDSGFSFPLFFNHLASRLFSSSTFNLNRAVAQ